MSSPKSKAVKFEDESITFEPSENKDGSVVMRQDMTANFDPAQLEHAKAAGIDLGSLTNKKKQYLMNEIIDKNGAYSYLEDPQEYKKARKRLQNRESAVRSRQRKKNYQEILEGQIDAQKEEIHALLRQRVEFQKENERLKQEN